MVVLSSRPEGLEIEELSLEELELIAALLYNCKLGVNRSKYCAAAYSLGSKIDLFIGDVDFSHNASKNVDLKVNILNGNGATIAVYGADNIELEV